MLDLGAAPGSWSQVLLEAKVPEIYAIDFGRFLCEIWAGFVDIIGNHI